MQLHSAEFEAVSVSDILDESIPAKVIGKRTLLQPYTTGNAFTKQQRRSIIHFDWYDLPQETPIPTGVKVNIVFTIEAGC